MMEFFRSELEYVGNISIIESFRLEKSFQIIESDHGEDLFSICCPLDSSATATQDGSEFSLAAIHLVLSTDFLS